MCPKCAHGHILGTFWAHFGHKTVPMGTFFDWAHFGHIFFSKCAQNVPKCAQNVPKMCPRAHFGHILGFFLLKCAQMCPKCAHLQKCTQNVPKCAQWWSIKSQICTSCNASGHILGTFWAHLGTYFEENSNVAKMCPLLSILCSICQL